MAREIKLSQTAVTRIGRGFGLQPYRQETFKLSIDPMLSTRCEISSSFIWTPLLKAMVPCGREGPDLGART